jgi:hypothetical protein
MAFTQAFLEWEQKTEERGWLQGHQIGQEEGVEKGNRSLLSMQLSQRFGPLSDSLVAGINALDLNQLEALAIALFNFTDRADLETWLTQALANQLIAQFTAQLGPVPELLQGQFQTASLDRLVGVAQVEPIADFNALTERLGQPD